MIWVTNFVTWYFSTRAFPSFIFLDIYLQLQETHLIFHSVVLGLRPDPVRNFELESFFKKLCLFCYKQVQPRSK